MKDFLQGLAQWLDLIGVWSSVILEQTLVILCKFPTGRPFNVTSVTRTCPMNIRNVVFEMKEKRKLTTAYRFLNSARLAHNAQIERRISKQGTVPGEKEEDMELVSGCFPLDAERALTSNVVLRKSVLHQTYISTSHLPHGALLCGSEQLCSSAGQLWTSFAMASVRSGSPWQHSNCRSSTHPTMYKPKYHPTEMIWLRTYERDATYTVVINEVFFMQLKCAPGQVTTC